MDQNQINQSGTVPNASEGFGNVPNDSERFRTIPNDSERFRTIPNDSEDFRTVRNAAERKANHTLTVREAARLFEAAGVARTERSIVNWCQLNKTGVARLDAYFDPNERRYYMTPESVERAIAEEKAKATKKFEPAESAGTVPKNSERLDSTEDTGRIKELGQAVMDLKITNRAKDYFIDQLQKENQSKMEQLIAFSRKVGELETKLLQLSAPGSDNSAAQDYPLPPYRG